MLSPRGSLAGMNAMTTNSPDPGPATETQSLHGVALSASLTVKSVEESLPWYVDVVGFTIDRRHERDGKLLAVSLRAGEARILLAQDDGAKGWDRVKGEGFSLQITTDQNIDEVAKGIKERGGTLDSEPADMPWGARMFRLRDPDGFKFTISSVSA
jgi:uncharacterized glyoxalase superfamily protein PhnB